MQAVAVARFRREYTNEMWLKAGDVITSIREVDAHWLEGECDGRRGRFPRYRITALAEVERLAHDGNSTAQWELGARYESGMGGVAEKSDAVAKEWYQASCAQHNQYAIVDLGEIHLRDPNDGDKKAAFALFSQANHPHAHFFVAHCIFHGFGVPRDRRLGFAKYQESAAEGCLLASSVLGSCYLEGDGVPADEARALALWLQAARENNERVFFTLALHCMYRSFDRQQAAVWLRKSAETGEAFALCLLGEIFEKSNTTAPDFNEAMKCYKAAHAMDPHLKQASEAIKRLSTECANIV